MKFYIVKQDTSHTALPEIKEIEADSHEKAFANAIEMLQFDEVCLCLSEQEAIALKGKLFKIRLPNLLPIAKTAKQNNALKILSCLKANARMGWTEMGKKLKLPVSTLHDTYNSYIKRQCYMTLEFEPRGYKEVKAVSPELKALQTKRQKQMQEMAELLKDSPRLNVIQIAKRMEIPTGTARGILKDIEKRYNLRLVAVGK